MMMNDCTPISTVSPVASNRSNGTSVCSAMRKPAPIISRKASSTALAPTRPSSSPMAAKMKSVSDSGMRLGLPRLRPVPVTPPAENANCASTIWKPSPFGSAHGSSQMSTRSWTCTNWLCANTAPKPNSSTPIAR